MHVKTLKRGEKVLEYVINTPYFTYLRKLARRYKSVDIELELQAFLWELLTFGKPPSYAYVCTCLKNKALALAMKEARKRETGMWQNFEYLPAPESEIIDGLEVEFLLKNLSEIERNILTEIYLKDHSVIEVAKMLGITRQSVNKRKLKALSKLRRQIYA